MARTKLSSKVVPAATTDQLTEDSSPLSLPLVRETVEQHPEIMAPTSPDQIDRSAMFLTYLAFLGDTHRTAAALMTDPARVELAAKHEGWDKKVKHLTQVKNDLGPDEFLRELNRVVNFVQAVRLRSIMDRVLARLTGDGLDAFLTTHTKDTSNTTVKALRDVISCCEAVHRLTYTALGDIPGKRTLDEGDSAKGSAALSILGALSQGVSTPEPDEAVIATTPETKSTFPVDIEPLTPDSD
jgi:hypothetical protein